MNIIKITLPPSQYYYPKQESPSFKIVQLLHCTINQNSSLSKLSDWYNFKMDNIFGKTQKENMNYKYGTEI